MSRTIAEVRADMARVRNNTRCYKRDCQELWRRHKSAVADLHMSRMEMYRLKAELAALEGKGEM